MKIYSQTQPSTLLHLVQRLKDIKDLDMCEGLGRANIVPDNQFLQLAVLKLADQRSFKPHRHIYKKGEEEVIAQESWVVIEGSVKVFFYDLDNTLLQTTVLYPGDASMTFQGGHNYEAQEKNTIVYEYKTGPYYGIEHDKEFI
tara:strand:- start:3636 stop:4064 length:429 start_codon:yes stop_codon:yes gene_type:complete